MSHSGDPTSRDAGDQVVDAATRALVRVIALRDPLTGAHCEEVGELAALTATRLGLTARSIEIVRIGGRLHDLGKIAVPDRILRNRDGLNPRELGIIQAHTGHGSDVVGEFAALSPAMREAAAIVVAHHERWNGSGYPAGLAGSSIPLGARIVAVADAYSAMTQPRSYEPALDPDHAINQLRAGAGSHFDPLVVTAFVEAMVAR